MTRRPRRVGRDHRGRRPGGAQPHRHAALRRRIAPAEPVDVAQPHRGRAERRPRPHDDLGPRGIEPDHEERFAVAGRRFGEAEPAPLADRVVHDAGMAAEDAARQVDDVAALPRFGAQPRDEVAVAARGHEADVLAVGLVRHGEAEAAGEVPRFRLGQAAEREAQDVELRRRGGIQEVALVPRRFAGPEQPAPPVAEGAGRDIVAGRHGVGPEVEGRVEQVGELDVLVAAHAGDGRFAAEIAVGEGRDHLLAEPALVIEHVMRDVERGRHRPGIVDVPARAAAALAGGALALVVELQRDADDVVAVALQQRRHHRRIHPARHGHDDPRRGWRLGDVERVEGGRVMHRQQRRESLVGQAPDLTPPGGFIQPRDSPRHPARCRPNGGISRGARLAQAGPDRSWHRCRRARFTRSKPKTY